MVALIVALTVDDTRSDSSQKSWQVSQDFPVFSPRHSYMTYLLYFLFFSGIPCGPCSNWHYLRHIKHVDDDQLIGVYVCSSQMFPFSVPRQFDTYYTSLEADTAT